MVSMDMCACRPMKPFSSPARPRAVCARQLSRVYENEKKNEGCYSLARTRSVHRGRKAQAGAWRCTYRSTHTICAPTTQTLSVLFEL